MVTRRSGDGGDDDARLREGGEGALINGCGHGLTDVQPLSSPLLCLYPTLPPSAAVPGCCHWTCPDASCPPAILGCRLVWPPVPPDSLPSTRDTEAASQAGN